MNENRDRVVWLWGQVALLTIILLCLVLVWWAVSHYFGAEGVRTSMLGIGALIVFGVVFGSFAVAVRMVTAIHNNTINGIVDFQAADDKGEVARARVMTEAMRGDRDVMKLAARMAQEQSKAIIAADREAADSLPALPPVSSADWSVVPEMSHAQYDIVD